MGRFADDLFHRRQLAGRCVVAVFAGAQFAVRHCADFGAALRELAQREPGVVRHRARHRQRGGLERAKPPRPRRAGATCLNLSGQTTICQSDEIIRRCALAVGSESALAHIACAVGTPNVILLGDGHFGRFMPYSPLTSAVSLPIECFNCDWRCRYDRVHCVVGVRPEVIAAAVRDTLTLPPATRPRLFIQAPTLWPAKSALPMWTWRAEWAGLDVDVRHVTAGQLPPAKAIRRTTDEPGSYD